MQFSPHPHASEPPLTILIAYPLVVLSVGDVCTDIVHLVVFSTQRRTSYFQRLKCFRLHWSVLISSDVPCIKWRHCSFHDVVYPIRIFISVWKVVGIKPPDIRVFFRLACGEEFVFRTVVSSFVLPFDRRRVHGLQLHRL